MSTVEARWFAMDIGEEDAPYVIEPLVEPVPGAIPAPAPEPDDPLPIFTPSPSPEREPVPA